MHGIDFTIMLRQPHSSRGVKLADVIVDFINADIAISQHTSSIGDLKAIVASLRDVADVFENSLKDKLN
jgi:hypothetical protein